MVSKFGCHRSAAAVKEMDPVVKREEDYNTRLYFMRIKSKFRNYGHLIYCKYIFFINEIVSWYLKPLTLKKKKKFEISNELSL